MKSVDDKSSMNSKDVETLQNVLSEDVEIEFFGSDQEFPMPKACAEVKTEPISTPHDIFGNIYFTQVRFPNFSIIKFILFISISSIIQDNGNVTINGALIRKHVSEILLSMNNLHNDVYHDRRFVFILMLEIFDLEEMLRFNLNPDRQKIIAGMY